MSTFELITKIIDARGSNKANLLSRCDVFLLTKRLSDEEYTELIERINEEYEE